MMHWRNIKVSKDNTYFTYEGQPLYNRKFIEVLKFHVPGLAPVYDISGAYHINTDGIALYEDRYKRTFGYYCNRASVVSNDAWFHINELGERIYAETYAWCGNFQEDYCVVRNSANQYYHINLNGTPLYKERYVYAGDFKDGIACVKLDNGYFKHIDNFGKPLNNMIFNDLGIFHKNYATACDNQGWFHINKQGIALYNQRYFAIEPFYNGFSLVTTMDRQKRIINEKGEEVLLV
jgi:hypothetical protein